MGVVNENGHPQILALRLKIENRKIGEMEAIVARAGAGDFARPQDLVDKPIFHEALAANDHPSRRNWSASRIPISKVSELFKIVDGKINRIEALVTPVPYGMYAGWPPKK